MEREVLVSLQTSTGPVRVGRLWAHARRGVETATFQYDSGWLRRPDRFALAPALPLDFAPHHTPRGVALFGVFGDSAPDRWGRELMRRAVRQAAGGSRPPALTELDYLLRVSDTARVGALRYALAEDGVFQAPDTAAPIPPLARLGALLAASDQAQAGELSDDGLRLLLAPGSSLGGARPKASVLDANGRLALAKFPARTDDWDAVRWEAVALRLAEQAGVAVPARRMALVGARPVLIIERFDRRAVQRGRGVGGRAAEGGGAGGGGGAAEGGGAGEHRIPFLSALSALGAADHETRSYLELVDFLRVHGARPQDDMRQLWRRVVLNVLISNTDDHLRNHGFLHQPGTGWTLSPAYDLNPVPADIRPRVLSTALDFDDATASLALALEVAPYFELAAGAAHAIAAEVAQATAQWRGVAARFGLSDAEQARMASAFEHADSRLALGGAARG